MFVRVQRIKRPSGKIDEYVQILESYRDQGQVRQRVIANLGNKLVLRNQLPALLQILDPAPGTATESGRDASKTATIQPTVCARYGIVWVVHHLFSALGLWEILDGVSRSRGLADRVAVWWPTGWRVHRASMPWPGGWRATGWWTGRDSVLCRCGRNEGG